MKTDTILNALRTFYVYPFQRKHYSSAKYDAQNNLEGRTHYVDDATLKSFHARVLASRVLADGLLFSIVESCALDMNNRTRGYRVVTFDVFGTAVHRANLDEAFATRKAAEKAHDAWLSTFDVAAHYRAEIASKISRAEHELEQMKTALACIAEKQEAAAA